MHKYVSAPIFELNSEYNKINKKKCNSFQSNKRQHSRKQIRCTNCGHLGHRYSKCKEPTTSWGIILIKYTDKYTSINHEHLDLMTVSDFVDHKVQKNLINNSDNIQILLISRRHSLGYTEFIRGKYFINKIDHIKYLIKQMTPQEITNILNNQQNFDYLWKDFIGNKSNSLRCLEDYSHSSSLFMQLVNSSDIENNLENLFKNTIPGFNIPEYGFPKGRRKPNESELNCACREFYEESGYTNKDIKIIKDISPIVEDIIGTNGVKYKHIYYIAELVSNKLPPATIDEMNEFQICEVGSIGFYNLEKCIELIRNYHTIKLDIVKKIFSYYNGKLNEFVYNIIT